MYKGSEGMWSWIFHRITGIGVLLFLFAHIVDTALIGWGPEVYNRMVTLYSAPPVRVMEVLLVAAVLYHALNGLRVILIDFWAAGVTFQRQIFYVAAVIFVVLFVPSAYLMLEPIF
ncbi:MAG: succinate dehydrogenase, cytochrome b556 subunit [Candidatus Latescibacteria bacterium]|nr:succinate dehydrogenase, cytochrome b556 subunit [Candidatus Latescibacterota bacterium]